MAVIGRAGAREKEGQRKRGREGQEPGSPGAWEPGSLDKLLRKVSPPVMPSVASQVLMAASSDYALGVYVAVCGLATVASLCLRLETAGRDIGDFVGETPALAPGGRTGRRGAKILGAKIRRQNSRNGLLDSSVPTSENHVELADMRGPPSIEIAI